MFKSEVVIPINIDDGIGVGGVTITVKDYRII